MQITAANVGDILCLYQTGKRIKILDVGEDLVTYQQESGARYCTDERHADAFVDRDPQRISMFNQNSRLGQALSAAESKAMKVLLSGRFPLAEREEANRVLSVVQEQKKTMDQRMMQERKAEIPDRALVRAFLDQLYEMGTGSHDTFFGQRVENLSQTTGSFSINGQRCDFDAALHHLSRNKSPTPERKVGLDAQIARANNRRVKEDVISPGLSAENHER